jgi:DNA-binding FadR family transcriptional regulator
MSNRQANVEALQSIKQLLNAFERAEERAEKNDNPHIEIKQRLAVMDTLTSNERYKATRYLCRHLDEAKLWLFYDDQEAMEYIQEIIKGDE